MSDEPPLPPELRRVRDLDPALAARLEDQFVRLLRAADGLAWAQSRLPALAAAPSTAAVLRLLVGEARALTGAPAVWALWWTGDPRTDRVSFRALAGAGPADLPAPNELSSTVLGQVAREGVPAWSDDARADARFLASHSVQSLSLRSMGCVPIGDRGALYLVDPDRPGRFGLEARMRLAALCKVAGPFLGDVSAAGPSVPVEGIVGESVAMGEVYDGIRAFAPMPWPVLVLGETGSGKELVARAIHDGSPRKDQPFVAVNCGAIPTELAESTLFGHEKGAFTGADRRHEGLVERVRGGTLFLDEVAELSPAAQTKLLRLLQERVYERVGGERTEVFRGRVIAATLRPIDAARGGFRDDLYHRLAACVIRVPPLRERPGDVPALARALLERALGELPGAPRLRLGADAERALASRAWPGNVRELENTLRSAVARCIAQRADVIGAAHLPAPAPSEAAAEVSDLKAAVVAYEMRVVRAALDAAGGNRTLAAQRLGVSRQWLHRILARGQT